MSGSRSPDEAFANRMAAARERAIAVGRSPPYRAFVEFVRTKTPWRFKDGREPERFLRCVETHFPHLVAKLLPSLDRDIRTVFDFGCGSGSSSIPLAMMFPEARFHGVDISASDIDIAHERAKLYGVADRCRFERIEPGQALPAPSEQYDLCLCFSVFEYIVDPGVRKYCVQEMARVLRPGGILFMAVPNRLYPVEIHSGKLGWNYFPTQLGARMCGSHAWEVQRLARPYVLKWHRIPAHQLLTPWANFALKKIA